MSIFFENFSPGYAIPCSIASEVNEIGFVELVEIANRLIQPALRVVNRAARQRIVDRRRPARLLERSEYQFLVLRRLAEAFNQNAVEPEFPAVLVPVRQSRSRARLVADIHQQRRRGFIFRPACHDEFIRQLAAYGRGRGTQMRTNRFRRVFAVSTGVVFTGGMGTFLDVVSKYKHVSPTFRST